MADIRSPFTDHVAVNKPTYDIAPNKGNDPCAPVSGGPGLGQVTPAPLPFNSLKIGTPDKGNSAPPESF